MPPLTIDILFVEHLKIFIPFAFAGHYLTKIAENISLDVVIIFN